MVCGPGNSGGVAARYITGMQEAGLSRLYRTDQPPGITEMRKFKLLRRYRTDQPLRITEVRRFMVLRLYRADQPPGITGMCEFMVSQLQKPGQSSGITRMRKFMVLRLHKTNQPSDTTEVRKLCRRYNVSEAEKIIKKHIKDAGGHTNPAIASLSTPYAYATCKRIFKKCTRQNKSYPEHYFLK